MGTRPALQGALAAIRSGDASGLIAAKIDRLGRSAAEVLALVEQARREGWRTTRRSRLRTDTQIVRAC